MALLLQSGVSTPPGAMPKGMLYIDAGQIEAELKRRVRGEVRFDQCFENECPAPGESIIVSGRSGPLRVILRRTSLI
jgi:hypothetical protein